MTEKLKSVHKPFNSLRMKNIALLSLMFLVLGEYIRAQGNFWFVGDTFICVSAYSWTSDTTGLSFIGDVSITDVAHSFNPKKLLKEDGDSAVANLRLDRNFKNWIYRDAPPIIDFSGCHLKEFELAWPLDNLNIICQARGKGRAFSKSEFLGVIIHLLSKQPSVDKDLTQKGELGTKTVNVFYVRLDSRSYASVSVWWNPAWNIKAWELRASSMQSWGTNYKIFFTGL